MFLLMGTAFGDVRVSISGGNKLDESSALNIKVSLPFDEEYKINLRNRDENRRALVNIMIDGRAVTLGGLILRAGETVNLERFLDTGTLSKGNKFKFIPKDEEALREANKEDGMMFVTVKYEKSDKPLITYQEESYSTYKQWRSMEHGTITDTATLSLTTASNTGYFTTDPPEYSKGITVEGGESAQRFQREKIGELEDQIDTLIIWLIGYYKTQPILLNK